MALAAFDRARAGEPWQPGMGVQPTHAMPASIMLHSQALSAFLAGCRRCQGSCPGW
jgi:hypothetical protein